MSFINPGAFVLGFILKQSGCQTSGVCHSSHGDTQKFYLSGFLAFLTIKVVCIPISLLMAVFPQDHRRTAEKEKAGLFPPWSHLTVEVI